VAQAMIAQIQPEEQKQQTQAGQRTQAGRVESSSRQIQARSAANRHTRARSPAKARAKNSPAKARCRPPPADPRRGKPPREQQAGRPAQTTPAAKIQPFQCDRSLSCRKNGVYSKTGAGLCGPRPGNQNPMKMPVSNDKTSAPSSSVPQ
jgi:hypothetical protein